MPALFIPLFIIAGRPAASQLAAGWKLYIFFALSGFIKYLTSDSAAAGLAFASLLLVMFFSGILFYSTTPVGDFRRALTRLLRPIPSGGGERLSELIAMTMAFLPLIFRTSSELSEAEYSRGFRPGKNPLRTLKIKSLPLLIHLFQKSDEMADAYYSRGYGCSSEKKK